MWSIYLLRRALKSTTTTQRLLRTFEYNNGFLFNTEAFIRTSDRHFLQLVERKVRAEFSSPIFSAENHPLSLDLASVFYSVWKPTSNHQKASGLFDFQRRTFFCNVFKLNVWSVALLNASLISSYHSKRGFEGTAWLLSSWTLSLSSFAFCFFDDWSTSSSFFRFDGNCSTSGTTSDVFWSSASAFFGWLFSLVEG